METRSDNTLENLSEAQRGWILELATQTRLVDLAITLKEHGIETSAASLSRFVRRDREHRLIEDGKDMKGAVDELAVRGQGEALRKGTLEAVRQRLYERAVNSNDPEETRELYGALLREEEKLKLLELEERKAALAEENARLKRLELEARLRERKKIEVESMAIADCGIRIADSKSEEGKGLSQEKLLTEGNSAGAGQSKGNEGEAFRKFWERMSEILNRGGRAEEKVIDGRICVEEIGRMLGNGS